MARPRIPDSEKHDHEFRVRLQETDAMMVRAISRKLGIKPAEVMRILVKSRLESLPSGIDASIPKVRHVQQGLSMPNDQREFTVRLDPVDVALIASRNEIHGETAEERIQWIVSDEPRKLAETVVYDRQENERDGAVR
jgi:hypothetical protein